MDTTLQALQPCPFCGKTHTLKLSTASELMWDEEDQGYPYPHSESYTVACDASKPGGPGGCGATSGYFPTEGEAVASWNRRAGIAGDAAPQEQPQKDESVREQAVALIDERAASRIHWVPLSGAFDLPHGTPLYASPLPAPAVRLTDEQIDAIWGRTGYLAQSLAEGIPAFARAIEQALHQAHQKEGAPDADQA